MRIAFTTLGCKINQFETDAMRQDLIAKGSTIVPFDTEADVYVINTCSVTAKSDNQSRQMIRSAIRQARGAKVVVTGCYAETRPEEIKKIPGIALVIGNRDKSSIPDRILSAVSTLTANDPVEQHTERTVHTRTRGFLKIQDGCDNCCSYCIVPLARGASRSTPPDEVMREFNKLVSAGCPEVVLSGIHIGTYGTDLIKRTNLTELLNTLLAARGTTRIRLSSIEPNEISDEMIDHLGNGVCKHLHVPLQSGDDGILSSMKRKYSSRSYSSLLKKIADRIPYIALGADIMVGYPGEGEEEFQNTMQLVKESPLTHLHVFSFSSRPGTPAADMRNQVPDQVKKKRSEQLRELGMKKNMLFREQQREKDLKIIVEDKVDDGSGLLTGLTDNYIRVLIFGAKTHHIGKEIKVRLNEVRGQNNFGIII